MNILNRKYGDRADPKCHPDTGDRVAYLKTLVERGGYNRYTYEGVEAHEEIQALVALEMAAYTAQQRAQENAE